MERRPLVLVVALLSVACGDSDRPAGERSGPVHARFAFNTCPFVTALSVSPTKLAVGDRANVQVRAEDAEGDPISFHWTASAGAFDAPEFPGVVYTCAEPGEQTLTLWLFDTAGCTASAAAALACTPADP